MTIVSYRLDEKGGILFGRRGFNAVPQVHDVSRGARLLQNFVRSLSNDVVRRVQDGRVQVALHAAASRQTRLYAPLRDAIPTVRHIDGPVQAYHVHARGGHALNQGTGVLNVNDGRNFGVLLFDFVQDLFLVGRREFVVIARREVSGPGIKNLNQLSTVFNLETRVFANVVSQLLENTVEEFGFCHGHFLDFQVFATRLAFDKVGGEGVRTANETKHGGVGSNFLAQCFQCFGNKRGALVRINFVELLWWKQQFSGKERRERAVRLCASSTGHCRQLIYGVSNKRENAQTTSRTSSQPRCETTIDTYRLQVVVRLDGRRHDGSQLFVNFELCAHSRKRRENVGKENASVGLVVAPGLQRHFDGHFGNLRPLAKGGILFHEIAVLLDVAARLAHHPDGRAFRFLALGGAYQERVRGFFAARVDDIGGRGGFDGARERRQHRRRGSARLCGRESRRARHQESAQEQRRELYHRLESGCSRVDGSKEEETRKRPPKECESACNNKKASMLCGRKQKIRMSASTSIMTS